MSADLKPWWVHWRKGRKDLRKPLTKAFLKCWTERVDNLRTEQGLTWQDICAGLSWERYWLDRQKGGAFENRGGCPALYFYSLAVVLGVSVSDLLPSERELLINATKEFVQQFGKKKVLPAGYIEAYVEFHIQRPRGCIARLDMEAVHSAFTQLNGMFTSEADLTQAITESVAYIDSILTTLI